MSREKRGPHTMATSAFSIDSKPWVAPSPALCNAREEPNPTFSTRVSSGKVLYRMITTANLTQVFGCVKLSQQSIRIISGVFPTPA